MPVSRWRQSHCNPTRETIGAVGDPSSWTGILVALCSGSDRHVAAIASLERAAEYEGEAMPTCSSCGLTTDRTDLRFCTRCGSPFRAGAEPFPTSFASNGVQWELERIRAGKGLYRSTLGHAELSAAAVQSAMSGVSPLVQAPQEHVTSGDLIKIGLSLIFVFPFVVIGLALFPWIGGAFWGGGGVVVGLGLDALIIWAAWHVYRSRS